LVAAHDEEASIAGLLDSIAAQSYPRELIEVWLVADRCDDQTAEVAERAGARVLIRGPMDATGELRRIGKGHALNDLLAHHRERSQLVDVFIVLDADVRLAPDYLVNMLAIHATGFAVVQGASFTKNLDDTQVTRINSWANRVLHVIQQGRSALGWPCTIIGNTLLVDRSVMERLNWRLADRSPTEEEIKIRLVADEIPIGYAADARIWEEAATNLGTLAAQRSRWFRDYVVFLVWAGWPLLLGSLLSRRWRRAEAALAHFWLTSHVLETLAFGAVAGLSMLSGSPWLMGVGLSLWVGKGSVMAALCYAAGMRWRDAGDLVRQVPRLMVGWLGGVAMWLVRPSTQAWHHTRHTGSQATHQN
jgi:cellulose synthase/poly-beta-1,6-N-acetylglucosamine synthase-like glycosyltransferase